MVHGEGNESADKEGEHSPRKGQPSRIGIKSGPISSEAPSSRLPPEPRTLKGLWYLFWALVANAAAAFIILISILVDVLNPGSDTFLCALGGIAAAALLILIFMVLWIVGIAMMNLGRYEYGPLHEYNVWLAAIFFIVNIAIVAIIGHLGSLSYYTFVVPAILQYIPLPADYVALGFASNILISLMWVFFIIDLSPNYIKKLLWLYLILNASLYAVINIMHYIFDMESSFSFFLGSMNLIAQILLIVCYWCTYTNVLKGEIRPIPTPMRARFYPRK